MKKPILLWTCLISISKWFSKNFIHRVWNYDSMHCIFVYDFSQNSPERLKIVLITFLNHLRTSIIVGKQEKSMSRWILGIVLPGAQIHDSTRQISMYVFSWNLHARNKISVTTRKSNVQENFEKRFSRSFNVQFHRLTLRVKRFSKATCILNLQVVNTFVSKFISYIQWRRCVMNWRSFDISLRTLSALNPLEATSKYYPTFLSAWTAVNDYSFRAIIRSSEQKFLRTYVTLFATSLNLACINRFPLSIHISFLLFLNFQVFPATMYSSVFTSKAWRIFNFNRDILFLLLGVLSLDAFCFFVFNRIRWILTRRSAGYTVRNLRMRPNAWNLS